MSEQQPKTEPVKWAEMSPEQRDRFVHEKVMAQQLMCDVQLLLSKCESFSRKSMFFVWHCPTCDYVGDGDTPPDVNLHPSKLPVPRYSQSMDAAWLVWGRMKDHKEWGRFCFELDEVLTQHKYRRDDRTYITWFEQFLSALNADAICLAALRACGVEIAEK